MFNFPQFWDKEELYKLQIENVTTFMRCDTQHSVEVSVEFAKYLHYRGLDSDNYLLFMELLVHENHYVVDALLGDENAFDFFSKVQLNHYLLDTCFNLLYSYSPGGVYERTLDAILGIIFKNYHSAREGVDLYPLTVENINSIGKFLDKSKPQSENFNRTVLNILSNLAELGSKGWEEYRDIGDHANKIRNIFFDRRVQLDKVIPPQILVRKDYKTSSLNPRNTKLHP